MIWLEIHPVPFLIQKEKKKSFQIPPHAVVKSFLFNDAARVFWFVFVVVVVVWVLFFCFFGLVVFLTTHHCQFVFNNMQSPSKIKESSFPDSHIQLYGTTAVQPINQ